MKLHRLLISEELLLNLERTISRVIMILYLGFLKSLTNFFYMLKNFLPKLNFVFYLRTLLGGADMCVNVLDYVTCVGAV